MRTLGLQLHIGCGGLGLPGWVNIDVNGGDLRMDLRWPLPFPTALCGMFSHRTSLNMSIDR